MESRYVAVATGPTTIPDGLLRKVTILRGECVRSTIPEPSGWRVANCYLGINSSYLDPKITPPRKGTSGFDKFFKKNTKR